MAIDLRTMAIEAVEGAVGYILGIDVGTTFCAAATSSYGRAEIFPLGSRAPVIPSIVVLRPDGSVLVGESAERRSISEPARAAREFKRRLGDPTPLLLGGTPFAADSLMTYLYQEIFRHAVAQHGGPPDRVVVTHPATYGPYKRELLSQAVNTADMGEVQFLSEPEAAAIYYSERERVNPGDLVAVYDFGGGTFDAAVLRKTAAGFELVGSPEGLERLGGIDFDHAVFGHVQRALGGKLEQLDISDPAVLSGFARLRVECAAAKEALSVDTEADVLVVFPGLQAEVRVRRDEFEEMVRPRIAETVSALQRAVRGAGVAMEDVSRIVLVGGSSRIPLVGQILTATTMRPVGADAHPKFAIALGAALAGSYTADAISIGGCEPSPGPEPPEHRLAMPGLGRATIRSWSGSPEPIAPRASWADSRAASEVTVDLDVDRASGSGAPALAEDVALPPPSAEAGAGRDDATTVAFGSSPDNSLQQPRRHLSRRVAAATVPLVIAIAATVALTVAQSGGTRKAATSALPSVTTPLGLAWRGVHDAPTARQQVAATVVDGVVWVLGGLVGPSPATGAGGATPQVEGYDPAIDTWKAGPDLPLPLHHAMAVTYRGEIVVLGGWVPHGPILDAVVSGRVFVLRSDRWVELPSLNHPRAAGAAAVVGDRIVVAGGQANRQLVATTEVFEGTTWKDAANIPTPRDHVAAVSDGRFVYLVGGRMLSSDKNSAALERYDPVANTWQKLPNMPTPRGGLGAATVGRRIITVGGEYPTGVFDAVQAYDIDRRVWAELPPMRTPRHGAGVVAVGNSIYAIDGGKRPTHTDPVSYAEVGDIP